MRFIGKGNCTSFVMLSDTVGKLKVACDTYQGATKLRTDFIELTVFGDKAQLVQATLGKGDWVEVEGEVRTGKYTNKENVVVYTTDLVLLKYTVLSSKAQVEAPVEAPVTKTKAKSKSKKSKAA